MTKRTFAEIGDTFIGVLATVGLVAVIAALLSPLVAFAVVLFRFSEWLVK